jgi:hypothetical protein
MFQKGCDIGFFADLSMHYFQFIPFTVTDDWSINTNVMSGTMMTVFVKWLRPYVVFLFITRISGNMNYIHQITSEQQRCPDVVLSQK